MIVVVGLGYIGLPTALMLSAHGNQVIGYDINEDIINELKAGKLTFEEDGLADLYNKARDSKITFTSKLPKAEIYIVAVPTPFDEGTKKIDPAYIINAINSIIMVAQEEAILVIESTVSPGTLDHYVRPIIDKCGMKIHLAHAPERIIPGNMVYELIHNARTIGADSEYCLNVISKIYKSFCQGEIVQTSIRVAEMTKVVENAYRDVNIAFANELTQICRSADIDVYEVIEIANKHPRVNILNPGPGVGGHCISVDPWFLVGDYPGLANLILTARKINDSMPKHVWSRIISIMADNNINSLLEVGIYGLTYKENVVDTRLSPTLQMFNDPMATYMKDIKVFDPYVKKRIISNQIFDFETFIQGVKFVVIMVGHDDLECRKEFFRDLIVLDTKNTEMFENAYKL